MSDAATLRARPVQATAYAVLALGVVLLLGLFWSEAAAAFQVWVESTAYGHCFLVLPIALYMIWDRRERLAGLTPQPAPLFALLALPLSLAWFAAERLGIMEGRQLVAVALLETLLLTLLGWRMFRALMAPLLYLFFLVPFGAFLTPLLQRFTARFIEVGLVVLDIPHVVTDMLIEVPAGQFFVAEACAGLRFLIAAVAFGVFYAVLNYTSPWKRVWFILASILVPVVANGVRALGIVLLGQALGSARAAAADHIIYGWGFFTVVLLLLVLAGLPFRDPPPPAAPVRSAPPPPAPPAVALAAMAGVLLLASLGPAAAGLLRRRESPAALLGRPHLIAPGDCTLGEGPASAESAQFTLSCTPRQWTVRLQTVPARATASQLATVRNRMAPIPAADEATTGGLAGSPGWLVTVSSDPGQITAVASWTGGEPARGGLAQRLAMARSSLSGEGGPSLVMTVSMIAGRRLRPPEIQAATAELARFVAAQPDLSAEVARLTLGPAGHNP